MAENPAITVFPRSVRPAPEPLGLYIRASRNDHKALLDLLAVGEAACFGAVIDPALVNRHAELRDQLGKHRLDAILDPKTQQSATPGGYDESLGKLPWGLGRQHRVSDFKGESAKQLISAIASFVSDNDFSKVVSPTHLLRAADDPWFAVDISSTHRLRDELNRHNSTAPIIYSLAIPYAVLREKNQLQEIAGALKNAPIDELWLKIDGLGSGSTPNGVKNYLEGATEFRKLGIPVVADHIGGVVGLSLMAFGAVGGIAHGVTFAERFSASTWKTPRTGDGFSPHHRVYLPTIDAMLKVEDAKVLLDSSTRARGLFGCSDPHCCPRGVKDMLENPGRHFLYQRMKEVSGLGQVPETIRPQRFLEQHLRPATDKAVAASTINWEEERMAKKMQENRKRLDNLRIALGKHVELSSPKSFSLLPKTRAAREARQ